MAFTPCPKRAELGKISSGAMMGAQRLGDHQILALTSEAPGSVHFTSHNGMGWDGMGWIASGKALQMEIAQMTCGWHGEN